MGLVLPWNFPLLMPHSRVIPALMAGNPVSLKPSEESPLIAAATYGLTSRSYLRSFVAMRFEDTRAYTLRNWEARLGVGYYQELPWGIITYVQPEVTWNPYKGVQVAFGRERTDWQYRIGVSLIKRDLEWLGFAPELRYTYIKNNSTIDFYDYDRHRVELGVTREF